MTNSPKPATSILERPETESELQRLEWLATWLDRRFIDPLLGFVFPGAGDSLCSLLGLYSVFVALKIGVHPIVIARMLINLSIDAVIGGIPFIGVVFDVVFRSHVKNLELIKSRGTRSAATAGDWFVVGAAALLFLVALLLPLVLAIWLITFLFSKVSS